MKLTSSLLICVLLIISSCGSDEKDDTPNPIVGEWKRNFYQFKGLPISHKDYENLMLPSPYVKGTSGIYNEDSYDLTFNANQTFTRRLIYSNPEGAYSDKGSWKIEDNQLIIDSERSANNEVYTLHSNSGTTMALYQVQTWWLLPGAMLDTLSASYYEAHSETLFDDYAEEVELKMYFFFKRP